jgi:hypothetical protein
MKYIQQIAQKKNKFNIKFTIVAFHSELDMLYIYKIW